MSSRPLRMLELCAGIGAMSYVWRDVLGQEIAGQVEIDPYCLAVLMRHFPGVPRLDDIRKVQGGDFGHVDLVAGGIPCQPFSVAGKRRGTADDRHLWPEMLRIIDAARPAWVVIENVAGFVAVALDDVCADLESRRYAVRAFVLPAAAVGAPHLRERCFVVAHAQRRQGGSGHGTALLRRRARTPEQARVGGGAQLAYTAGARRQGAKRAESPVCRDAIGQGDRQAQPLLGGVLDGVPAWLDGHRWPAGPGEGQHEWEAPRTVTERIPNRAARLKALGNAIVPQQVAPILAAVVAAHQQEIGATA